MKKFIYLFIFLAFLNAEIVVNTKTKTASGVGMGSTREYAVSNAISEALGKIVGVRIDNKKIISIFNIESSNGSFLKDQYSEYIRKSTSGKVDSYTIDNVIKLKDGYKAYVTVKKNHIKKYYKVPGLDPNSRRRIVIVPDYTSGSLSNNLDKKYSNKYLTDKLTSEIMNSITQTRKFTVLDRQINNIYNSEKKLIKESGDKDELLKIGKVLGADYFYVVSVNDFVINKISNKNNLTGKINKNADIKATIDYKIIVMATRQIKYANSKTFKFKTYGDSDSEYLKNAFSIISKNLTDDIINNIYPIKVVKIIDKEIILNQKLNVGDKFEIFSLGEKIYDPYNKEYLGQNEIKNGILEIIRITPKISYAKILSGSVKKGDICRPIILNNANNVINKSSDVKINKNGGVVLPF